jgi:NAD(P)-dependent dehydrogenase (short-subunit alcohol dehydrogenase family)
MTAGTFDGRVAIVTGGGGGLGAAICQSLATSGASVYVADINMERAEATAGEISAAQGNAQALRLDVMNPENCEASVREVLKVHPEVDILINSAGIDVTLPLEELTVSQWQSVMDVNLSGPFLMSKAVLPGMRAAGRGHIVNIASTAAKRAWPNASAYQASKWGLMGLSHALHSELRCHNIKVTVIVPGGMRTPFLLERFADIDVATLQEPAAVAETVKFVLCQPEGTVIPEVMVLPMKESSWP